MVFCSTLNNRYFEGACVTLSTLRKHNPVTYPYYIFCFERISSERRLFLETIYPNIIFQDITEADYAEYKLNQVFRKWDFNVFNRFEIFTLSVDKIVFLDFDILILGDLSELFNFDCNFGACIREQDCLPDYLFEDCFEAGVMVVGKKFITPETKTNLLDISKSRDWTSDEPVLNYYFHEHTTFLPKKYNVMTSEYGKNKDDISILHYIGSNKPWFEGTILDRYDPYIMQKNTNSDFLKLVKLYDKELSPIKQTLQVWGLI